MYTDCRCACGGSVVRADGSVHRGQSCRPRWRRRRGRHGSVWAPRQPQDTGPVQHPAASAVACRRRSHAARCSQAGRQQVRRPAGRLGASDCTDDAVSGSTTTSSARSAASHHQTAPASGHSRSLILIGFLVTCVPYRSDLTQPA